MKNFAIKIERSLLSGLCLMVALFILNNAGYAQQDSTAAAAHHDSTAAPAEPQAPAKPRPVKILKPVNFDHQTVMVPSRGF